MSQHCKSSQTENACIATSKCIKITTSLIMSLLRDMKRVSRDKSVDLTGVLSCRATLFERLRHNHLSLRQVPVMWRHKPDLLLFRTIAGTGDLLKQACSKYIIRRPKGGLLILQDLEWAAGAVFSVWQERTWISMRETPIRLLICERSADTHALKDHS